MRAAAAALLFPLLTYSTPVYEGLSLSLVYFVIPPAALLAQRHGRRGMLIVAVGPGLTWVWVSWGLLLVEFGSNSWRFIARRPAWPLLPLAFRSEIGTFQNEVGVMLVALAAALLARSDWPERRSWGDAAPPAAMVVGILVLLGLRIPLYGEDLGGGWQVTARLRLLPACYAALFFLGLTAVRHRSVLVMIAVATLAGAWLRWYGVLEPLATWVSPTQGGRRLAGPLRYEIDLPVSGLCAVGCFLVGRSLRERAGGNTGAESSRWAKLHLAGLLLSAGDRIYALLPADGARAPAVAASRLFGEYHALPLAALFAGFTWRAKGVATVAAAWVGVTVAAVAMRYAGVTANAGFALEELLLVLSFGALGIALVGRVEGRRAAPMRPERWVLYIALLATTVPLLFDLDEPSGLAEIATTICSLFVLALLGAALLRRAGAAQDAASSRGWLGLAGCALFGIGLLPHLADFQATLGALPSPVEVGTALLAGRVPHEASEGAIELTFVGFVYVGTFGMALVAFADNLPAVQRDARQTLAFIRGVAAGVPLAADPVASATADAPDRTDRIVARVAVAARLLRNVAYACAGVTAGVVALTAVSVLWHER